MEGVIFLGLIYWEGCGSRPQNKTSLTYQKLHYKGEAYRFSVVKKILRYKQTHQHIDILLLLYKDKKKQLYILCFYYENKTLCGIECTPCQLFGKSQGSKGIRHGR